LNTLFWTVTFYSSIVDSQDNLHQLTTQSSAQKLGLPVKIRDTTSHC